MSIGEVEAVVGGIQLSLGKRIMDARALALLAERNPLAEEIHICLVGGYRMWNSDDGRRFCAMPVALDPLQAPSEPPPPRINPSQAPPSPPPAAAASPGWALTGAPPIGPVKVHD